MPDPKDCDVCTELEEGQADIREVAKHFIAEHEEWLGVLRAALTIAQAQSLGSGWRDG